MKTKLAGLIVIVLDEPGTCQLCPGTNPGATTN